MKQCWFFVLVCLFITNFSFAQASKKVVVLGFDGADHRIVETMMHEGELPNLTKLKKMGGYAPLTPTNPPQTPVSWSTFATGINPGRTGIFDFIKRKAGTYIPDFALRGEQRKQVLFGEKNPIFLPSIGFLCFSLVLTIFLRKKSARLKWVSTLSLSSLAALCLYLVSTHWLPTSIPSVYTVRQGKPIWKILEEQGKSATILRLPVTFPAEPLNGEMISGLAVPDIRGTIGKPSIYTNDPNWTVEDNQFSIEIKELKGNSPYQTSILGPPNKLFYKAEDELQAKREGKPYKTPKDFEHPLTIEVLTDHISLEIAGTAYTLHPKSWSPWIKFDYKVNPLISLFGSGRFYLDYLRDGAFKLYLSPIHLHPDNPLPLSYPASLAKETWQEEPYKTMGWALDTWSIGNGLMDEEHFLADVDLTVSRFETMMENFLETNQKDLFVQVFSFTDRVGHVLWRYWDEGHPLYDPQKATQFQEALRNAYRRMDHIVGKAMALINLNDTVLIVCSDHGFSSWRYQFHFNTWLVEKGYMKLKKNVLGVSMKLDDLQTATTPFNFVNWQETKAYALGLGMIFINLEGREPEGCVPPEDYQELCRQLATDLEAFVDERTGQKPVRKVYFREEMYHGYDPATTPDLRVATNLNYRVSWDTTLGGMPKKLTEDNLRNWSGDHCSLDPKDVQGILFSSAPIKSQAPNIADLCPSILEILGATSPPKMDGVPILESIPSRLTPRSR